MVLVSIFSVLGIFLAITGQAPSIVRACAVSSLALLAWYFGRKVKPSVLILVPAAVTAYISPLNYWFSLGWWLSFLAFFGVLVVAPLLVKRFLKREPNILIKTAIETTSAQLMTIPLIIWVFGKISVIAVLANLLVLPLIPLAMITTFVTGIAGMLYPSLAGVISWSATLVLRYITDVVSWLAEIPWSLKEANLDRLQMLILYGIILLTVWVMHNRRLRTQSLVDWNKELI